jgi:hypothetical protein
MVLIGLKLIPKPASEKLIVEMFVLRSGKKQGRGT